MLDTKQPRQFFIGVFGIFDVSELWTVLFFMYCVGRSTNNISLRTRQICKLMFYLFYASGPSPVQTDFQQTVPGSERFI